ncbi:meiotic recombination protein REC8 homolog [Nematolebias whitei]|uniref:meiotic recombination protein REC8 homolog n=1 Tax=Nematolebias whitei TaxID=451745 RepID=UPI001897B138|nr:meiotic recombination protein REC8 homolog [Nematolebias whitei]
MFYYPAVLQRHTGCFSTIWLVATKGIKVPRRDFMKINVINTCDDIMNYLLERVPPPRPGLPRPRFSLYLSSQLQYGVVVVYHRQCAILLEELQSVVSQLLKQSSSRKNDLTDHSRKVVVLPDALSLMEETEGAPDPLFGVMNLQDALLSPTALIQMSREYLREASPELPEFTSPAVSAAPELEPSGITASPDTITLREMEPVTIPAAEFEGQDLVDHPDTIDMLLAQTDPFSEGGLDLPREEVTSQQEERELEREGDQEKEKTKELTRSTTELQPATVSSEDAVMLPQKEPGPPAELPGPPREQITPISAPVLPSPPSAARKRRPRSPDVHPEVRRKRRKRQLIFFDPETQLPESELQQQINDPLTETRRPVLPLPSRQRIVPASKLFNNPSGFLPDEVLSLWRQAATISPLLGSDLQVGERGPESTDSEREREREAMEEAEKEQLRLELICKEVQRDVAEIGMIDFSAEGTLSLEASDQREASREISPVYTSDREGSIVSRAVQKLPDIPEAEKEVVERAAVKSPGLLPDLLEFEGEAVLFQSLLPPEVNRRTVSSIFQNLLEHLSSRRIRAEQDEPYGDIFLFPGDNY